MAKVRNKRRVALCLCLLIIQLHFAEGEDGEGDGEDGGDGGDAAEISPALPKPNAWASSSGTLPKRGKSFLTAQSKLIQG